MCATIIRVVIAAIRILGDAQCHRSAVIGNAKVSALIWARPGSVRDANCWCCAGFNLCNDAGYGQVSFNGWSGGDTHFKAAGIENIDRGFCGRDGSG